MPRKRVSKPADPVALLDREVARLRRRGELSSTLGLWEARADVQRTAARPQGDRAWVAQAYRESMRSCGEREAAREYWRRAFAETTDGAGAELLALAMMVVGG